jgi:hypothetical protein
MSKPTCICVLLLLIPTFHFGQTVEYTSVQKQANVKIGAYSQIQDSKQIEGLTELEKIGNETANYLSRRTQEEKEWFKRTFVHKKGSFSVPDKPITCPVFKEN